MVTSDEINANITWMADRFMLFATRFLLGLLVNVSASESKDNLLTSAIHIVSLYYGSIYRYTKKSLLDVAIEEGQPEAVKCLVNLGESIDRVNLQGKSPLHLAASHGQLEIVEFLLSKGADASCLSLPTIGDDNENDGVDEKPVTYNQTPLHLAISNGNKSVVECFINHLNSNQSTIADESLDLELPSNLNIKDSQGLTPLCLAKKLNHESIERLLEETNDNNEVLINNRVNQVDQICIARNIKPETSPDIRPLTALKSNFTTEMKIDEEKSEQLDSSESLDSCKEKDSEQTVQPPSLPPAPEKLIQRRDPLTRLLNLHLIMKSDNEIRYEGKLSNSPSSPPVGYIAKRKVSFVTEYFEKIESRRESLYRTDSGRWSTPDTNSMSDKNGNIFSGACKSIQCEANKEQISEPLTIHEVANNGAVEIVALHIDQLTSVDMADTDGNTPLHHAARGGQVAVVRFLLSKGANLKCKNSEGRNALHVACFSGDEDVVRELILFGIDLEARDNEKNTALIIASSLGHLKIVQLLTSSGAQVNVKNSRKQTPLHKASFNGFADVVDHLIVKGAQTNVVDSEKDTPLHLAAHKGHIETVRILLDYGATSDVKNKLKRQPFHEAAYNGSTEVMNLLLSRKTNLNSKDKNGDTALNLAAAMGHSAVIELLLERGARINPKKDRTTSALHMAVINEHVDSLELLLERKANIAVKDKNNDTPLHFACSQGNTRLVQTLLNYQSPVNVKGSNGRTPLHLAVLNEQTKMISMLLEKGADKTIKDSDGKTALHYAKVRSYQEAIQELSG
ncbi:ankyrin-1 [Tetranychus urticae]|uniref:Uncharacterized protein n=1 Tax=Tetranychus urticae TaxID=32264 RepID=T1KBG4_TETUR|nr:ankyrin-1 [Tetranychus urticae]